MSGSAAEPCSSRRLRRSRPTVTGPDGQPVDYGHVAKITDLAHRPGLPDGLRQIVRRVPITARDRAAGKLTDLEKKTGWRYGITATNIQRMRRIPGTGHPQWRDALHRQHAVVEDRVRTTEQTGLGHLPSASWQVNTVWTLLGIAASLNAWTRLLGFTVHDLLAKAEPATMRELVYRLPARLARHARHRHLRFDSDHPHTGAIAIAWQRLHALTT